MFTLPDLNYGYDALEPVIDARTMEIHHSLHHAGYVKNLNGALEAAHLTDSGPDLEGLLRNLNELPEAQRTAIRNNGGGHFNHSLFWNIMSPGGSPEPSGNLGAAISVAFGTYSRFKELFENAAKTRFGSGWAWLYVDGNSLQLGSSPNQDNPIIEGTGRPILGLDVWEHAYYLQYQNRRPEYVSNFWSVVDWGKVGELFDGAIE